jgi:flagellar motor switch protein FliM
MHEDFIRESQSSLSLLLRTRTELKLLSVEQQYYTEFTASLADLTNIHMFDMSPTPGTGLVELSMPVVYAILDRQLGGDGTAEPPARVLTSVEAAILEPILKLFFRNLQDALSKETTVELERRHTESNPKYAHITSPDSPVVVACIEAQVGESAKGLIHICYPGPTVAGLLREHRSRTTTREVAEGQSIKGQFRKLVLSLLMDVPVTLPVVLGEVELRTEDWLDAKPGDVFILPRRIHEPVRVQAGGQPLYEARPGRVGSHLAVRLLRSTALEQSDVNNLLD